MAKTFRSALKWLVPSWLNDEITQSLSAVVDEHIARARAGLEARMPSRAGDDALTLIGQDRRIPRGRTELASHYAQRLIRWRSPRGHRVRGSAFALLEQVSEYFGGLLCWTIDFSGTRYDRSAAGVETFSFGNSWTWDTDTRKARFWLGIELKGAVLPPDLGDPALWGGALGTPGYSIGQLGVTPDDVDAIRGLFARPTPWKPAGTLQQWAVIKVSPNTYTPDATWANWSKVSGGVRLPSRGVGWRYWALAPELKQYTPVAANATTSLPLPDGTTYAAVAASATASIVLPDGTTYTPDATKAKAAIDLVDDGDQP
jgi:hypothetical protein